MQLECVFNKLYFGIAISIIIINHLPPAAVFTEHGEQAI